MGRPVICLDVGGPAIQVDESCGFKIEPRGMKQVIADIAQAMRRLASDENLLRSMGHKARQRATDEFTWDKKVAGIEELYRQALSTNEISDANFHPMTEDLTTEWAT